MRLFFLLAASLLAGCTSKAGSDPSPSAANGASQEDSNKKEAERIQRLDAEKNPNPTDASPQPVPLTERDTLDGSEKGPRATR
ncbi:hypothetical protein [Paenibacillus sp. GCM10027626]|uniref:hypothetical protein n=1 Tax=Paenibacillus sp. GCM10027626 TaxID=3273411 RepID=UPI00362BFC82